MPKQLRLIYIVYIIKLIRTIKLHIDNKIKKYIILSHIYIYRKGLQARRRYIMVEDASCMSGKDIHIEVGAS